GGPLVAAGPAAAPRAAPVPRRSGRGERRAVEHPRAVLDELDAAVEGGVVGHLERDVRVAVVDPLLAGGAGDDREHHHPEPVDHPAHEEGAGQGEAPERAEDALALRLHARTAATASPRTSVELAHPSGSSSVFENTSLGALVSGRGRPPPPRRAPPGPRARGGGP